MTFESTLYRVIIGCCYRFLGRSGRFFLGRRADAG